MRNNAALLCAAVNLGAERFPAFMFPANNQRSLWLWHGNQNMLPAMVRTLSWLSALGWPRARSAGQPTLDGPARAGGLGQGTPRVPFLPPLLCRGTGSMLHGAGTTGRRAGTRGGATPGPPDLGCVGPGTAKAAAGHQLLVGNGRRFKDGWENVPVRPLEATAAQIRTRYSGLQFPLAVNYR